MIVVNDGLVYVLFVRTSRHVRWDYAEYCGRYATAGDAIDAAKARYDHGEYRIEKIGSEFLESGTF